MKLTETQEKVLAKLADGQSYDYVELGDTGANGKCLARLVSLGLVEMCGDAHHKVWRLKQAETV